MHTRGAAAGRDETCAREQLRVGVGCPQSTVMAQGVALHEEQLVMMAQRPAPTGLTRWRGCFLPSPARHMNTAGVITCMSAPGGAGGALVRLEDEAEGPEGLVAAWLQRRPRVVHRVPSAVAPDAMSCSSTSIPAMKAG